MPVLVDYVESLVAIHNDELSSADDVEVAAMSGIEYEAFCASVLEARGWQVRRTPPTGDQGVDLVAEKDGRRVAIQCKRHGTPVGNNCVQEAYSGMDFYEATEAIVVSNSTYTAAARLLANKLNVSLIHHSQLTEL